MVQCSFFDSETGIFPVGLSLYFGCSNIQKLKLSFNFAGHFNLMW